MATEETSAGAETETSSCPCSSTRDIYEMASSHFVATDPPAPPFHYLASSPFAPFAVSPTRTTLAPPKQTAVAHLTAFIRVHSRLSLFSASVSRFRSPALPDIAGAVLRNGREIRITRAAFASRLPIVPAKIPGDRQSVISANGDGTIGKSRTDPRPRLLGRLLASRVRSFLAAHKPDAS